MPFDSELDKLAEENNLLEHVLDMDMERNASDSYETGAASAAQIQKFNYGKIHSYKNVTSYSTQTSLFSCPRYFQLEKMRRAFATPPQIASVHFAFGHAVGAGIAAYDETRNLEAAVWAVFCGWDIDFFAELKKPSRWDPKEVRDSKKSILWATWAILSYPVFFEEDMGLSDWDTFRVEAEVLVEFSETETYPKRFYTGHIDTILKHKQYGSFMVKENKTTGFSIVDPQMYANSEQALSYAVVVDMFGQNDYDVLYCVYSSVSERWMHFTFPKSILAKASWLQDQFIINDQLEVYEEKNFFPMRGSSCLKYGDVCQFYGQCATPPEKIFGQLYSDLEVATMEDLRNIQPFEFYVKADDILASLRKRTGNSPQTSSEIQSKPSSLGDSYMEEMK